MVEHDFGEAILNLVSNACYAMRQKQQSSDDYAAMGLIRPIEMLLCHGARSLVNARK